MKLRIRHTGDLFKNHFDVERESLSEIQRIVDDQLETDPENILWVDFYTGTKSDKGYKSGKYYIGGRLMTQQDVIDEFVEDEGLSLNPLLFLNQMSETGLFVKLDYRNPGKMSQLGGIYDYKPLGINDKIISYDLNSVIFEATGKSDIDPESDYTP